MTEHEWFACTNPTPMLEFVQDKSSDRKLRLFAVACCRRIWHHLVDERSRRAVELAEQSADNDISPNSLDVVSGQAEEAFEDAISPDDESTVESREKAGAACAAASYASNSPIIRLSDAVEVVQGAADAAFDSTVERGAQSTLVREIWGNHFHPVALDPTWLTSAVRQLAAGIYEEKAFDRMPILGDALEETGCANAEILNHCRQSAEHVRGCWVIDLLLNKE